MGTSPRSSSRRRRLRHLWTPRSPLWQVAAFVTRAEAGVKARLSEGWGMSLKKGQRGPRVWRQNEDVALGFWISRAERKGLFNVTWVRRTPDNHAPHPTPRYPRRPCRPRRPRRPCRPHCPCRPHLARPTCGRCAPTTVRSTWHASRPRACTSGRVTTQSRSTSSRSPGAASTCGG